MPLRAWFDRSDALPGAPGLHSLAVPSGEWRGLAQDAAAAGARLVALWASADSRSLPVLRAAYLTEEQFKEEVAKREAAIRRGEGELLGCFTCDPSLASLAAQNR